MQLDYIPNSDPPWLLVISDNPVYAPYNGSAEEVNIIGRFRLFTGKI